MDKHPGISISSYCDLSLVMYVMISFLESKTYFFHVFHAIGICPLVTCIIPSSLLMKDR